MQTHNLHFSPCKLLFWGNFCFLRGFFWVGWLFFIYAVWLLPSPSWQGQSCLPPENDPGTEGKASPSTARAGPGQPKALPPRLPPAGSRARPWQDVPTAALGTESRGAAAQAVRSPSKQQRAGHDTAGRPDPGPDSSEVHSTRRTSAAGARLPPGHTVLSPRRPSGQARDERRPRPLDRPPAGPSPRRGAAQRLPVRARCPWRQGVAAAGDSGAVRDGGRGRSRPEHGGGHDRRPLPGSHWPEEREEAGGSVALPGCPLAHGQRSFRGGVGGAAAWVRVPVRRRAAAPALAAGDARPKRRCSRVSGQSSAERSKGGWF